MGGSNANCKAIKMLQEGIRFDKVKQKYVSVLPWIKGRKNAASILNVLDSEGMAKRRVTQMMPRFDRDPTYYLKIEMFPHILMHRSETIQLILKKLVTKLKPFKFPSDLYNPRVSILMSLKVIPL